MIRYGLPYPSTACTAPRWVSGTYTANLAYFGSDPSPGNLKTVQEFVSDTSMVVSCTNTDIYYVRKTNVNSFDAHSMMLVDWVSTSNTMGTDFDLYSNL